MKISQYFKASTGRHHPVVPSSYRGTMVSSRLWRLICILVFVLPFWLATIGASGQQQAVNQTADDEAVFTNMLETCKGIVIQYALDSEIEEIIPISDQNKTQPYKFFAKIELVNAGYKELHGWEMFIDFQYGEVIAEAPGVAFLDGSTTPGALVGNGTVIVGTDTPDLLTSIETAEDLDLIAAKFNLTGTEFGVGPGQPIQSPLPKNIALLNAGYSCQKPHIEANTTMFVCCPENNTAPGKGQDLDYQPRYEGDITMYFDVIQTMKKFYEAQVTINMDDPIGSLTHWNLTWDWKHGEFIYAMKGAQTLEQDQHFCIDGPAGKLYPELDFSMTMSCQPTPTFVDLSPDRMADQLLIGCCRNGTLLPKVLDPLQSKSVFTLQVYKILPNLGRKVLEPPVNWRIKDIMATNSPYECDNPRLVSPSEFYDTGLHYSSAVKSFQVTCNKTKLLRVSPHKCCVSFSAYYNDSVVPCPTCSCGCNQPVMEPGNTTCNPDPKVEAMLLPKPSLLLPPSNRTALATTLAKLEHYPQPDPVPCPDNCGSSMNWHIHSDYSKGFSARMTLFNWVPAPIMPWFAVLEFNKATPGLENVFSFNGTKIVGYTGHPNTSLIFIHGKDGFNTELLGLDGGLVPGLVQSVLAFDKRKTPVLDVPMGDGFPTRVWMNGDECRLPDVLPTSGAVRRILWRSASMVPLSLIISILGPLLMVRLP